MRKKRFLHGKTMRPHRTVACQRCSATKEMTCAWIRQGGIISLLRVLTAR